MGLPPISSLVHKDQNGVVDKTQCYLFLSGMLIMLNEYFGVSWSDSQVEQTVKGLYGDYYYWSVADWKLFCKKCHKCEFDKDRKLYGSWTPEKLESWAESYDSYWLNHSEDMAIHNHELERKLEEKSADVTWFMRKEGENQFKRFEMQYEADRQNKAAS